MAGWPENVSDVPNALRPYHQYCNEMTVEDGLILKGEALIVPPAEGEKILKIPNVNIEHGTASTGQASTRTSNAW